MLVIAGGSRPLKSFTPVCFWGNFSGTLEILPPVLEVRMMGLLTPDSGPGGYFHSTSQEVQKLATYTAKSFQLLGALRPGPLARGYAPGLHWRHSPQTPSTFPQCLLFPPKPRASW